MVEPLETLETIGFTPPAAAMTARAEATRTATRPATRGGRAERGDGARAAATRSSIPAELTLRGSLADAGARAGEVGRAAAPTQPASTAPTEAEPGLETLETISTPPLGGEHPLDDDAPTRPRRAASAARTRASDVDAPTQAMPARPRGDSPSSASAPPRTSSPARAPSRTGGRARPTSEPAAAPSPRPGPPRGGPLRPTVAPRVPAGSASSAPSSAPPPRRTPPPPRRKPS
jgi:hypothetical protein